MKWRKYTIYTTTGAEDLVSMMLSENGVEGVQIENNVPLSDADTKGMFIDILPELPEDDGSSRVSFFLHIRDEAGDAAGCGSAGLACGKDTAEAGDSKAAVTDRASECGSSGSSGVSAGVSSSADNSYTIADRIWEETEIAELLETVKNELEAMREYADIGEGRIEAGVSEDTDWRDNWKSFFKPIKAGEFIVKPTWEEIPAEYAAEAEAGRLSVIEIDPGTAFGTGSHETTQLCLEAIKEYVNPGDKVLDIGTGSGILGIAALKSGASCVMATELDEMCEASIMDNIGFNGITGDEFGLIIGNVIGDAAVIEKVMEKAPSGYDVVIANILAPVIAMLASPGQADRLCRSGGVFITSGIIDTRLEEVKTAFEANPAWEIIDIKHKGEWTGVRARRV